MAPLVLVANFVSIPTVVQLLCAAAEKKISEERMARRQAIGKKYSVRLDNSVSSDLQKLRDRPTAAKTELSAIRADVVTVTSPVRRSPADPPRATAGPPKPKQMPPTTVRPVPPTRPPVYSLRPAPATRQPAVRSGPGPGIPVRGAIAVGQKAAKQQTAKVDGMQVESGAGRQKVAVGKPLVTSGTAVTRPVRSEQQNKPSITLQLPQPLVTSGTAVTRPVRSKQQKKPSITLQLPQPLVTSGTAVTRPVRSEQQKKPNITLQQPQQRRVPPAQMSPKPPTNRRPVETVDRHRMPRVTNQEASPRKRELKKHKTSNARRPKVRGGPFPADVDKQYTMKKFMAQRESELSTSTRTASEKPSLSNIDDIVAEVARDVSEVVDIDKLLQATTDETRDHPQSPWLELSITTDEEQRPKSDIKLDELPRSPQATFKGTAAEKNKIERSSKTAANTASKKSTIPLKATKDQMATVSAAKQGKFKMAEKHEGKKVKTEKTEKLYFDVKTKNENEILTESQNKKTNMAQSSKPLIENKKLVQNSEGFEHVSDEMALDEIQKDEDRLRIYNIIHDDAKETEDKTGYEAQVGTLLDMDEDRVSSVSLYDDHETLLDFDNEYDELRMLAHRMTSSTEGPMSSLSGKESELVALLSMSTVSHRDLASPALPLISPPADAEATQTSPVQETDTSKYIEECDGDAQLVKVINSEHKTKIIIDLGYQERDGDSRLQTVQDDEMERSSSASNESRRSSMTKDDLSLKGEDANTGCMLDDGPENPIHDSDDDEEERYWSGSEKEDADELLQQQDSFEEESDDVDPAINTRDSSDNEDADTDTHHTLPHQNKELEHEAPGMEATASADDDDAGKMDERFHIDVTSRDVTKVSVEDAVAEDDKGSIADEQITKETIDRVLSNNAGLTEDTEPEHVNVDDDRYISAAFSGTLNYLELEYGIPSITSLDREEELDESLRGEGPATYQDEEAARMYSLGEDGLPDFGAEYSLGITAEKSEELEEEAAVVGGRGQLLSESEDNAVGKISGAKEQNRMDDEVSILPEAAQSEDWDDELFSLNNPSQAAEVQEPNARNDVRFRGKLATYEREGYDDSRFEV